MKKSLMLAAVVVAALLVPNVVMAATGSFSSSTGATALSAINSSSGRTVNAVSNTGYAGVFTRNSTTGTTPALAGVNKSGNGVGVYGLAAYHSATPPDSLTTEVGVFGRTNGAYRGYGGKFVATGAAQEEIGVYGEAHDYGLTGGYGGIFVAGSHQGGTGVRATGSAIGVNGQGNEIGVSGGVPGVGDGTFGVWSGGDLFAGAHMVAGGNLAGTCTIDAVTTSQACSFPDAFGVGIDPRYNIDPIVVITPTSNPGAFFWVSSPSLTGFTVNLASAPSSAVSFNYIVVGLRSLS